MQKTKLAVLIALLSVAFPVFATEAPVYDVETYPPQFDGQDEAPVPVAADTKLTPVDPPTPAVSNPFAAPSASTLATEQTLSLEQRVAKTEHQVNSVADLMGKLSQTQATLQAVQGQVETLEHAVQELRKQQSAQYADLDRRIVPPAAVISPKPVKGSDGQKVAPIAAAVVPINTQDEQALYQSAYNLIKTKKYAGAAAALQKMLQKYPQGQYSANAHYWLGELYGLMGKNDDAVAEFQVIVKNYPDSPKIADAQLKLGLIYAGQFKWNEAKKALKTVSTRYPGTSSARLAAEQLRQIIASGH
jgi:tol-pal system protein YbgF